MRGRRRPLAQVSLAPYVGIPARREDPSSERSPVPPRRPVPARRGEARPWGGRAPVTPAVPVSRGSTAQVQGLYPWLYGGPLPAAGAYIGIDCLTGGAFTCHPLAWLGAGLISNPNIVITGLPGAGKSALVKALALRLMPYGVRTFVCGDLKNEYAALARAVGAEPAELGPGLPGRLNPLDAGPLGENLPLDPGLLGERLAEIHRRRLVLLCSLAAMRLGRALSPTEEAAVSLAIHEASGQPEGWPGTDGAGRVRGGARLVSPAIGQVWALLRDPSAAMARELRVRRDSVPLLREMIRPVTDALGGMVTGALAGLFDGPTTIRLDWDAPIQTVDLSRVSDRGDDTVAMILACVSSWAQAALDEPGPARMVVRDELWRSLRVPALVRKTDSDLRLSRALGTMQVLATHRLSDFEAVGAAGSAEAAIAAGLIASCDTRICLRQDTGPLNATREQIGLTDTECAHISSWTGRQAGRAVWKIGRAASAVVQTVLTPAERGLFHTRRQDGAAEGLDAARPVAGCVTGPACRTRHEERVLAWLLQDENITHPGTPALPPGTFTTHSRDEIYQAWRAAAEAGGTAPGAARVRHELTRRMLRAPSWAASFAGRPFGQTCLAYLDRLTITPVTRGQGEEAANELARADTVSRAAVLRAPREADLAPDLTAGAGCARTARRATGPSALPPDGPAPSPLPRM